MANEATIAEGLKVAIVGGSIAGCAVAIELLRIGCDVTLFERSGEALKDRGAGIGIPKPVIDTLIRRDLVDADTPYFAGHAMIRSWRTSGAPRLGYVAWNQPADLALLNWGGLYRNLRTRVPDRIYQAGKRVVDLREAPSGRARVELSDGATPSFDLVVCADGYNSLGRRRLFPDIKIEYAGYVLWRGILREDAMRDAEPLDRGVHSPGYPGGHGIFYFVPGADGSVAAGRRLVNWGMYLSVPEDELAAFFTDRDGRTHEGSMPPGAMPLATESELRRRARAGLPDYYNEIVGRSENTFAYAIYDCQVPAFRHGRICLAGDAGAFARPHTAAGALKSINDAIALAEALKAHRSLEAALATWNQGRVDTNNRLVIYGQQLGRALVEEIPDWSTMDAAGMKRWFDAIVDVPVAVLEQNRPQPI
ncbi:MAG TPA: FAD-dependent monooxygenase [Candidatus Binataceae bacterium]|nr:FAD-dependent monooxygenase [Candidatus Binataceae bacterium]